jgi:succinoglycan biosynthesis transport protein ExoP
METNHAQIQKYYKMVVKRRYLFLSVALLVMSLVVWGCFFLPKKFEASSTVFVEKNVIKDLVKGITFTPSVEDKIRVLKYAMLSRVFVTSVLSDIDQDIKTKNEKQLEELVAEFQKHTQISVKGNDLFIVKYSNKDPKLATDYINTLVRKYVEQNVSNKRDQSYGADRFLTEQLKSFKDKIDKSDEEIIKFRQQQGVFVGIDEPALVREIKTYQTELEAIKIKRNELIAVRDTLKRQLKSEDRYSVVMSSKGGDDNPSNQITALENKRKQLLVNYTDNYPEVVRLNTLIAALKNQKKSSQPGETVNTNDSELSAINPVYQALRQQSYQVESEIEAMGAKQNQLHAVISSKERELRNVPVDKKKLTDLEKVRDSSKQIYEQLVTRQGQAQLSKDMEVEDKATTFRIVDPAIIPKKPVSPNRVQLILLGIAAGFAAGIGAVFVREMMDSTFKDVHDLRTLGYQVLAVIPTIVNESDNQKVKKRDRLVFGTAAAYMVIVCLTLVHEMLGFTVIEMVFIKLGLDKFILS